MTALRRQVDDDVAVGAFLLGCVAAVLLGLGPRTGGELLLLTVWLAQCVAILVWWAVERMRGARP